MTTQASPETQKQDGTEPELLARARAGDPEAFASLYNDHQLPVFRFVLARVRDRHLAEDLTQETFLRAMRAFADFAWRGTDVRAWLYTIARNLVIDSGRARSRRPEIVTGEIGEIFSQSMAAAGPEDILFREGATTDRAAEAIACLPDHQRQVVTLRFLNELTVPETAAALGDTSAAVRARTHKAMVRMRTALGVAA
ncbi:RNA polymerase sigma-70 factor (ECF subfamily) [Streptomyces sp. PvR006]|uniref:RNA polymerase sigma factor n=1 Tax=Streptomyces sp. PvR006 TaxID=2817860 RepID=UPI0027DAE272|nr:sigma-70 family RNA polymerase sigma factor [Streptomyces sp. PvR006]MBP2583348.1 RNA polymerase sigma-70 factor (ECF subfamily) [Streptomyces sp. PvR006]